MAFVYEKYFIAKLAAPCAFVVFPHQSFTLEFHFETNSYFNNTVLTKKYKMKSEPDAEDPFSFEGPEIIDCEGWVCRQLIKWPPQEPKETLVAQMSFLFMQDKLFKG